MLTTMISSDNTYGARQRAEILGETGFSVGRRLLMEESHLCVSRAADLKMKLLELHIMGNNAMGWRIEWDVLIVAMKSFKSFGRLYQ